jgi:hypothetical protein
MLSKECLDISQGRLAEEAPVFPIKLTGALVSHFERDGRGIKVICEQARPGRLQSQLLLILQRTHRRQGTEMMMERRDGHARHPSQFFHAKRFRIMGLDPGKGLVAVL